MTGRRGLFLLKKRALWGVVFRSARDRSPMLLWEAWAGHYPRRYAAEPQHVLTWTTRSAARAWARKATERYADLDRWRFTVVKVRERVEVIK